MIEFKRGAGDTAVSNPADHNFKACLLLAEAVVQGNQQLWDQALAAGWNPWMHDVLAYQSPLGLKLKPSANLMLNSLEQLKFWLSQRPQDVWLLALDNRFSGQSIQFDNACTGWRAAPSACRDFLAPKLPKGFIQYDSVSTGADLIALICSGGGRVTPTFTGFEQSDSYKELYRTEKGCASLLRAYEKAISDELKKSLEYSYAGQLTVGVRTAEQAVSVVKRAQLLLLTDSAHPLAEGFEIRQSIQWQKMGLTACSLGVPELLRVCALGNPSVFRREEENNRPSLPHPYGSTDIADVSDRISRRVSQFASTLQIVHGVLKRKPSLEDLKLEEALQKLRKTLAVGSGDAVLLFPWLEISALFQQPKMFKAILEVCGTWDHPVYTAGKIVKVESPFGLRKQVHFHCQKIDELDADGHFSIPNPIERKNRKEWVTQKMEELAQKAEQRLSTLGLSESIRGALRTGQLPDPESLMALSKKERAALRRICQGDHVIIPTQIPAGRIEMMLMAGISPSLIVEAQECGAFQMGGLARGAKALKALEELPSYGREEQTWIEKDALAEILDGPTLKAKAHRM